MSGLSPNIPTYLSQSTIIDMGPTSQAAQPGSITASSISFDDEHVLIPCQFGGCWADLNDQPWVLAWSNYAWRLLLSYYAAEFVALISRVAELCLEVGPASMITEHKAGLFGAFSLDSVRLGRSVASDLVCPSWIRLQKRVAGLVRSLDPDADTQSVMQLASGAAALATLSDGADVAATLWGLRQQYARLLISSASVDPGSHQITVVLTESASQMISESPSSVDAVMSAIPYAVASTLAEAGDGLLWTPVGSVQMLTGTVNGYTDFVERSSEYRIVVQGIADPIGIPYDSVRSLGETSSDLADVDPYSLLGFGLDRTPSITDAPKCLSMEGGNDLVRSMALIGSVSQSIKKAISDPPLAVDEYLAADSKQRKGLLRSTVVKARKGSGLLAANLAQVVPECDDDGLLVAQRRYADILKAAMLEFLPANPTAVRFGDSNVEYVVLRRDGGFRFDAPFAVNDIPVYWPASLTNEWFGSRVYPVLIIPAKSVEGRTPAGAFASWAVSHDGFHYISPNSIKVLMSTEWVHMRDELRSRMDQYAQSPAETDEPDGVSYWWLLLLLIPVIAVILVAVIQRSKTNKVRVAAPGLSTGSTVVNLD